MVIGIPHDPYILPYRHTARPSSQIDMHTHVIFLQTIVAYVMDRDGWSGKFHLCSLVIKKLLQFQISL